MFSDAMNGSSVYELFQICDWPGGNNAKNWNEATEKTGFLLSNYYVQNVEAPLKVAYGSTLYIEGVFTAGGTTTTSSAPMISLHTLLSIPKASTKLTTLLTM